MNCSSTDALTRQDLLAALEGAYKPDAVALMRPNGKPGWLYEPSDIARALSAWKAGALERERFETVTRDGEPYRIDNPTRLGVVLHRDGFVRCFCIDADGHDGETTHEIQAEADAVARLLGTGPLRWTSRGGGLHDFYRLADPVPLDDFLAWSKGHGFNAEDAGKPECFPKTDGLSPILLPNEPNDGGGDTYVSGSRETCVVRALPPAPTPTVPPPAPRTARSATRTSDRPGDALMAAPECRDVMRGWLVEAGHVVLRETAGGRIEFERPGQPERGKAGGNLDHVDGAWRFYAHSSNAQPLEAGQGYDALKLCASLRHGGDLAAAAREIAALGYGDQSTPAPRVTLTEVMTNGVAWGATETAGLIPRIPRQPSLDIDLAFPDSCAELREYVRQVAEANQVPVEMVVMMLLGIASGLVAKVAEVCGHGDHREIAVLWFLVLMLSANRKSAVVGEIARPIYAWEREEAERLASTIAEAKSELRIEQAKLKRLEDKVAKGVEGGTVKNRPTAADVERWRNEAMELAREIEETKIPTAPLLAFGEGTPQALAKQMSENDERAILIDAEGDAFDVMMGRYSSSPEFGVYLRGHAGDAFSNARISRDATPMDRPALAIALCTQPASVAQLWGNEQAAGRGLLARFHPCCPRDSVGHRKVRCAGVDPEVRACWQRTVENLLAEKPGEEVALIRLSPEADAHYLEHQTDVERRLRHDGDLGDRRAFGGKQAGATLRVALVLHALGSWGHDYRLDPGKAGDIDAATMKAAIVWSDFLIAAEEHARAVVVHGDAAQEVSDAVAWVREMERRHKRVTASMMAQSGPRRYRNRVPEAHAVLDALVASGAGRWLPLEGKQQTRTFQTLDRGLAKSGPDATKNAGSLSTAKRASEPVDKEPALTGAEAANLANPRSCPPESGNCAALVDDGQWGEL